VPLAFTGWGKVSGFKLLQEDESFSSTMAGNGQSFKMSAEQLAEEKRQSVVRSHTPVLMT